MKQEAQHNPFKGGRQLFAVIPKSERGAYNTKVMDKKSSPDPPPRQFKADFPSNSTFKYKDYTLYYNCVAEHKQPKAVVVHLHGMYQHSGLYGYYLSNITKMNPGTNAYAFDQLNFGRSEGPYRGEILSFEDSLAQVQAFIAHIATLHPNQPKIFLSGNSYGGAMTFKSALQHPQRYSGLILIAPALRDQPSNSPCLKKLGKMVGWMMPRYKMVDQDFSDGTAYNTCKDIEDDPLFYTGQNVAGSVRIVLNAMDEISQEYGQLKTPYITFQAGVDKFVDTFAGLDLEEESPSPDKTTIYCALAWHALLADMSAEGITQMTGQWLKQRI